MNRRVRLLLVILSLPALLIAGYYAVRATHLGILIGANTLGILTLLYLFWEIRSVARTYGEEQADTD